MRKRAGWLVFCMVGFVFQLPGQLPVVLHKDSFQISGKMPISTYDGWLFAPGNDPSRANPETDTKDWVPMNPTALSVDLQDQNGRLEGWFRFRFILDESMENIPIGIGRELWAATDIYLDGKKVYSFGQISDTFKPYNPTLKFSVPVDIVPGKEHVMAIHVVHYESPFTQREIKFKPQNLRYFVFLTDPSYNLAMNSRIKSSYVIGSIAIALTFVLFLVFLLFLMLNRDQKVFQLSALITGIVLLAAIGTFLNVFFELSYGTEKVVFILTHALFLPLMHALTLAITEWVLRKRISFLSVGVLIFMPVTSGLGHVFNISWPFGVVEVVLLVYFVYLVAGNYKKMKNSDWIVVAAMTILTLGSLIFVVLHKYYIDQLYQYENLLKLIILISSPLLLLLFVAYSYKKALDEKEEESRKLFAISVEKQQILKEQKDNLENLVKERTADLQNSLEHLRATQSQLIQAEKMASLGELTAGIAHEIQNPLNFVNNFSEVSRELIDEMKDELQKGEIQESLVIAEDLSKNIEKINHHGHRASSIVKAMLEHSRSGTGQKELTDINALCDEYLRLAYHGLRAKDKDFQVMYETRFDSTLPKINVVPQDIGRVLVNIINNAFYAVQEKSKRAIDGYLPKVIVSSIEKSGKLIISIQDNGDGIPTHIRDKIFQPFFTTKPTGQGTGLGLSLSYDIVKAHGGELTVDTAEKDGTTFIVSLPLNA